MFLPFTIAPSEEYDQHRRCVLRKIGLKGVMYVNVTAGPVRTGPRTGRAGNLQGNGKTGDFGRVPGTVEVMKPPGYQPQGWRERGPRRSDAMLSWCEGVARAGFAVVVA
jgi:hypothetical protein